MERPDPSASKDAWRAWARRERAQQDLGSISAAVVAHLASWEPLAAGRTVLLFLPLPDEVNLLPLRELRPGCRFVATRTPAHGGVLTIHELEGPLEVHRLGFLQPQESAPMVDPADLDVVLLPGLAFSYSGERLGRGSGYFDELLSRTPPTVSNVGVTPEAVIVERLPTEAHDVVVDHLATEVGIRKVDPRQGAQHHG